jgi:isopenicillin N synthase-like dioxygenase
MGLDGQQSFARPLTIDLYMETLRGFTSIINSATQTITGSLSHSLELPETANLRLFHRMSSPSPDIIRLLKYQPQPVEERGVPHAAHTDMGTLTFLFTRQVGLQIRSPVSKEWAWVQPMEGHAIVNLGDGMSLLTNGYLRSCVHRVSPLPDQAMPTRYSFAYMVRPGRETVMTAPETRLIPPKCSGKKVLTSGKWLEQKYSVLRRDSRPVDLDWMMTGQPNE